MKKTSLIFLCVLLSVFCFSSVSYSDKNDISLLNSYEKKLKEINKKIYDNYNLLFKSFYQKPGQSELIKTLFEIVSHIHGKLDNLIDVITVSKWIRKDKLLGYSYHLGKILWSTQSTVGDGSVLIDNFYSSIKNIPILHIIDKQRVLNQSVLDILNRMDVDLKNIEKKYGKNKSK